MEKHPSNVGKVFEQADDRVYDVLSRALARADTVLDELSRIHDDINTFREQAAEILLERKQQEDSEK